MGILNKKQEQKPADEGSGGFVSFVLLDEIAADLSLLIEHIREDWGLEISGEDLAEGKDALVSQVDGMMVAIALMPGPIPNNEAVENAKTNFRWPEAVAVAENHRAHLMVAVMPREQSPLVTAVLQVKLCASCLRQPNATAINTLGSVLAPDFYIGAAKAYLENGAFPIMNLIFFGLYSNDNGQTFCCYTYGMDSFGKKNIELINSAHTADEVMELMTGIAAYMIEYDVTLKHGETIGFSEEQKLPITESDGIATTGSTLKIQF